MSDPAFDAILNKVGTIYRPSFNAIPNSLGERRQEPGTALASNVPLCLQPIKEKFSVEVSGITYLIDLAAYMNIVDIKDGDILQIESKKYRVYGVEDEGGQGHHLKVLLTKED